MAVPKLNLTPVLQQRDDEQATHTVSQRDGMKRRGWRHEECREEEITSKRNDGHGQLISCEKAGLIGCIYSCLHLAVN